MKIDSKEIKHIAKLSRLSLSLEEEKKYAQQIGSVLSFVKMLDDVKSENLTKNLMPDSSELENVWRSDEVKEWDESEVDLALKQAELQDGYIKVKRVL